MEKHVLVVGGLRPLHKHLKKLGARLTLMIETAKIKANDATFYDRIIGMPATAPLSQWVDLAGALQHCDPPQAIGAYHELNQEKAAAIAHALGLVFHAEKTIDSIRLKDNMRAILRKTGIDPTASQRVETSQDIMEFGREWGYPLILKPVDGWASKGVSIIRNEDTIVEALDWYTRWMPNSPMQVEQFLTGEEFSVEAFSEGGDHHVLCITRKYKEEQHFVELGHCLPANLPPTDTEAIIMLVQKLLTALGVVNGPTHTEIMLTQHGPRIIETHTRLGGDYIPELYELVTEINLMEMWARQTLGERVLSQLTSVIPPENYAAVWYVTPQAEGTLLKIEGEEEAQSVLGVAQVQSYLQPGEKLEGMHDSFSRAAYALARGQSPEEALERARLATEKLRFFTVWPAQK